MCVICAAIPTTVAVGITLDKKSQTKKKAQLSPIYLRPFLLLTLFAVLVLMAISVFFHSRNLS
jgi:hypothetical protein